MRRLVPGRWLGASVIRPRDPFPPLFFEALILTLDFGINARLRRAGSLHIGSRAGQKGEYGGGESIFSKSLYA
jgi:hypothetical protein